jgi:cyclase
MLRSRIIPCLLLHKKGLVKTVNFKSPKYVGDPINAVRIFNEKEVDELSIFDIDASVLGKEPDYILIKKIANQSRMPLCYGGGVKSVVQAQKIFELGVEKIALSSAVVNNPNLITEVSRKVGSQSVIVVLDIKKKKNGGYEVFTHNATNPSGINPIVFVKELESMGAGEIIINSIDQDGLMKGYDLNLISQISEKISIPLTVLGGAGTFADIEKLVKIYSVIGVSAGSLFVFKGPYKAVLLNYPTQIEKNNLLKL